MNKIAALFLLLVMTGCAQFRPSWLDENSFGAGDTETGMNGDITGNDFDGPLNGHFNEDGLWVPDDPKIERTYKLPDIGAGFVFDANSLSVSPSLQVELVEFDTPIPFLETIKVDAGVAYQQTYLYVGPLLTDLFEISAGIYGGWNWEESEPAFGVGFTLLRF